MKDSHKICTLSFDEMVECQKFDIGLNTLLICQKTFADSNCRTILASKALVFMLGGIAGR